MAQAFIDIITYMLDIYNAIIGGLDLIAPLTIEFAFGNSFVTISQLIAFITVLFIVFCITVLPILFLYGAVKRIFTVNI